MILNKVAKITIEINNKIEEVEFFELPIIPEPERLCLFPYKND